MLRFIVFAVCLAACGAEMTPLSPAQSASPPAAITLPADAHIGLATTRPLLFRTVKAGDPVYAQTTYPVVAGDKVAVPAGTFVLGEITSLTKPTRRSNRAVITVRFKNLVLEGDYVVPLPESSPGAGGDLMDVTVQVSVANDVLLDNGTQLELVMPSAVQLDAGRVRSALMQAKPLKPGSFHTATLCEPTPGSPGSPGTPDTVIPGTPGTPDTVMPGVNGAPDTVIPGIPATPSTTIPGTPATPDTPGISCPNPPLVLSSVIVGSAAEQAWLATDNAKGKAKHARKN